MPMRITGMNSGMDIDGMVAELVKAQRGKVDNLKKQQTSLQWKQDAWKDLNSKALKLFRGALERLRFSDAYTKKATKASNEDAVTVVSGESTFNGTQELELVSYAKTGNLVGARVGAAGTPGKTLSGGEIKADTKLKDIISLPSGSDAVSFSVTTGGKTTEIKLSGDATLSSVAGQLRNAGINANYDAENKRFYLGAKSSGADNDFVLTANNQDSFDTLTTLGINIYSASTQAGYDEIKGMSPTEKSDWISKRTADEITATNKKITDLNSNIKSYRDGMASIKNELNTKHPGEFTDLDGTNIDSKLSDAKQAVLDQEAIIADLNTNGAPLNKLSDEKAKLNKMKDQVLGLEAFQTQRNNVNDAQKTISGLEDRLKPDKTDPIDNGTKSQIEIDINADITERIRLAKTITATAGFTAGDYKRTGGQNGKIKIDGIEYDSDSNTYSVNGMDITINQNFGSEKIILTTQDDTEGIYDMIKGFLKEYNALISEMDKLYNAPSNKSYQPLTVEEKDAMTDAEIEQWEAKVKESVMRKDDELSILSNAMKFAMTKEVEINGKPKYLTDFGIDYLSYFAAEDNEKYAFHIDGDADDSATANKEDKLRSMIATDPETVSSFFVGLSRNLHDAMNKIVMQGGDDKSSSTSVYSDKRMKRDYEDYTKRIEEQEKKVLDLEDKYYRQFSAMEVAMAKMQSSANAISGLLGGK